MSSRPSKTIRSSKTGKAQQTASAEPSTIRLAWQLSELPSSQHRAGLAGLVVLVRWLAQKKNTGHCVLSKVDARGAELELDQAGLGALFDELYAASSEEQEEPNLRKDKQGRPVKPIRETERTKTDAKGKTKTKIVYAYPVVVPRGDFLLRHDPTASGSTGLWVKLWRDMVWKTLRGVPATREPFEARAESRQPRDATDAWAQLTGAPEGSVDLPSTYFIGAQASTSDGVPFRDRARLQLLLHFWPYAAQVYVPIAIDLRSGDSSHVGFAVAVPDVSDLATFCDALPSLLRERGIEVRGFLPRDAVIDLPVESALDLAHRLRRRIALREGERSTRDLVLGFDVFHLNREGNNVRLLQAGRLEPDIAMSDEYARLRGAFRDPLFRRLRLENLLAARPWFSRFDRLAETVPHDTQFIGSREFRRDARHSFEEKKENDMAQGEAAVSPPDIEQLVYKLVGQFVRRRVESKAQITWETVKDNPARKDEYEKAKARVAREAFLAVRSRTGADFVDFFAGTLCSVPQFLREDGFTSLARRLREDPTTVRTLTLLALSAHG